MKSRLIAIRLYLLIGCVLPGCTPAIRSSWQRDTIPGRKMDKVLVAAIPGPGDSTYRKQTESYFAGELKSHGINAVSAIEEFGLHGLANLGEEETFVTLCSSDIEAVLTIVLLDQNKEGSGKFRRMPYTNADYYNRLWNYPKITADISCATLSNRKAPRFYWETMLFDLHLLEPVYLMQTKRFYPSSPKQRAYRQMLLQHIFNRHVFARQR